MADHPESAISKAIALLATKDVATHIETLLDDYLYASHCDGIDIDSNVPCSNEVLAACDAETIAKSVAYRFDNKTIHLLAANMRLFTMPNGESGASGNLFIYYNGECVLHNLLMHEFDLSGGSFEVPFYDFSIKRLKSGIWIDDLIYLAKKIKDFKERDEESRR